MIQEIVNIYMKHKEELRKQFAEKHPEDYKEIVKMVFELIEKHSDGLSYTNLNCPDTSKIHEIDDGSYQGTLLYLVPDSGYMPSGYYYVFINYGSCSGCDTLEGIRQYEGDKKPDEQQIKDYMTLCLHIVQAIKVISHYDEPI